MSGFSADWLRLREPADHAARDNVLTRRLVNWVAMHAPVSVLDLGTGTGSNLRFLAPRLGHDQQWRLIDNDPALLAELPRRLTDWAASHGYRFDDRSQSGEQSLLEGDGFSARISCTSADLADGIGRFLDVPTHLVTASALLDLVSVDWIDQLTGECRTHGCAACFALNYDGQVHWQPAVPDDDTLRARLNRHQQQSKGLGMALGPAAGSVTAERMTAAGLDVTCVQSNWHLDQSMAELQIALADGWLEAVLEQDQAFAKRARRWRALREAAAHTTVANVVVGHLDVLGLPATEH